MATIEKYDIIADSLHLPKPEANITTVYRVVRQKKRQKSSIIKHQKVRKIFVTLTYVDNSWGRATARIEGYTTVSGESRIVRGYHLVQTDAHFGKKVIGLMEVSIEDD